MSVNKKSGANIGCGCVSMQQGDIDMPEDMMVSMSVGPAVSEPAGEQTAVARAEAAAARQIRGQERVWLTINSTESDSTAVMIGVNGYPFRILRDRPVLVPVSVVEALKLAAYDVPRVEKLAHGIVRTTFKHVNRFSFSVEPREARKEAEDA